MTQFLQYIFQDWVTFAQFCILFSFFIGLVYTIKDITFTFNYNHNYTDKTPEPAIEFITAPVQEIESDLTN